MEIIVRSRIIRKPEDILSAMENNDGKLVGLSSLTKLRAELSVSLAHRSEIVSHRAENTARINICIAIITCIIAIITLVVSLRHAKNVVQCASPSVSTEIQ
jgi:hypothetical protein